MKKYDALVLGAGHNGLTTAAFLAKAGLDVLCLEKNDYIGGAAVSRELHEGWTYSNCSYVCSLLRPEVYRSLNLAKYGLQVVPYGGSVTISQYSSHAGADYGILLSEPGPATVKVTYIDRAAVIDGFAFDWAERRIPLSTVQTTDIVHWLALETSLQAVADAGYTRDRLPGRRTGVIVGNTLTGEQTRSGTMRLRWPFVRRALHAAALSNRLDMESVIVPNHAGVFSAV